MAKNKNREAAEPEETGKFPLAVLESPPSLIEARETGKTEEAQAFGAIATDRKETPGLSTITIDHANACFLLDKNPIERLEGYCVHWFQARAFWAKGYNARDIQPPDCFSNNMIKPDPGVENKIAPDCIRCPKAQFGSAPVGKGQGCKTNTFVFIVNPEFGTPPIAMLILPPSSIKPLLGGRSPGYVHSARRFKDPKTGKAAGYWELVWTEFRLEPGGDRHCVATPEPRFVCPNKEEAVALANLRKRFMEAMESIRGSAAAHATGEDSGG